MKSRVASQFNSPSIPYVNLHRPLNRIVYDKMCSVQNCSCSVFNIDTSVTRRILFLRKATLLSVKMNQGTAFGEKKAGPGLIGTTPFTVRVSLLVHAAHCRYAYNIIRTVVVLYCCWHCQGELLTSRGNHYVMNFQSVNWQVEPETVLFRGSAEGGPIAPVYRQFNWLTSTRYLHTSYTLLRRLLEENVQASKSDMVY